MVTISFDKVSDILLDEDIVVIDERAIGGGYAYPYETEDGNIMLEFYPDITKKIEITPKMDIGFDDIGMLVVGHIPLRVAKVIRLEV